jgi:protein SCO1
MAHDSSQPACESSACSGWRQAVLWSCLGLLLACSGSAQLSDYGPLPAFSLQNQRGQTISAQQLRGRVLIADFIFTSCPDVCPLLTEQLARLRKQLPEHAPLTLLSFSVDPEHDTPQRLQLFAAQHGVDSQDWWFLTGPLDQIKQVVSGGFKQAMELEAPTPGKPRNVLHGTHFVLIDARGQIRGFYRSDPDGEKSLKDAVSSLLAEGHSS